MVPTSLFDRGKVLITVGLNESVSKAVAPHVPYGPEEVAQAAADCATAGAAGVHVHARRADGSQDMRGSQIYRKALSLTASMCDVVMWTTGYSTLADPTDLDDLPHQWELVDDPPDGAGLEFGCFDAFRIGSRPAWSSAEGRFMPIGDDWTVDRTGTYNTPRVLAEMLRRRLSPVFCCYDFADARWASCAMRAGVLPDPTFVQLHIFAETMIGPSATVANLDAFVSEARVEARPEVSFVGFQFPTRHAYENMLREALSRGCHVRVGIGDAGALYPDWTNADVVSRAVEIVQSMGLEPATPAEMRQHFLRVFSDRTPTT